MVIIAHFKTDAERQAFELGYAFYIGVMFSRGRLLVYDANTNNPYWITTENGHHFLIDDEGTIQSGRFRGHEVGEIKASWERKSLELCPYLPETLPTSYRAPRDTKIYLDKAGGSHKHAIKEYYDQEYRDRAVEIKLPIDGKEKTVKAEFARSGFRDEFTGKHAGFYKEVLECMPYVVDVLRYGQVVKIESKAEDDKKSHTEKNIVRFYTLAKIVVIKGKRRKIAIDVAETKQGFFVNYNLMAEGIRGWPSKEEHFDRPIK